MKCVTNETWIGFFEGHKCSSIGIIYKIKHRGLYDIYLKQKHEDY